MQFFYKEYQRNQVGQIVDKTKVATSSFNTDHVLKTSQSKEGGLIVVLNDGRLETVPVFKIAPSGDRYEIDKKTGQPIKINSRQEWRFTEIELDIEESKNFIYVTGQDQNYPLLYTLPELTVSPVTNDEEAKPVSQNISDLVAVD